MQYLSPYRPFQGEETKMLDFTDVKAPIEKANGLPNGCYVDPDLYQHE